MQLREIMTSQPKVLPPTANLQEAAKQMRELEVGVIPICENNRVIGMITDRDITVRAIAEGRDPSKTAVRDVMTPNVVSCFEDQDVAEAAQLMEEHQIRRLIILDRENNLSGVIALGDLATHSWTENLAGEALERISEPTA